ncbi:MAG TPA: NAD(P)H-binding protein [Egibacteraceae bacterium]|nr:NAD(P)H-binding protein [Egibacteraceae bacterium]
MLGATGRTGVPLVGQALARGHSVRALVRSHDKAARLPADDRLTLVEGDLLDAGAVSKVIEGSAAVLNVAGPGKGSPPGLQQRAIGLIIAAMTEHGVDRLITLTGAGVRDEGDQPKVIDRLFHAALKTVQGQLLADSEAYVRAVRDSGLRWTVVRAPRLVDAPVQGRYRVVRHVGAASGTKLARTDLATFILDELDGGTYVGAMPVVSA